MIDCLFDVLHYWQYFSHTLNVEHTEHIITNNILNVHTLYKHGFTL